MQNWRAAAQLRDNSEALIILGDNHYEITSTYEAAFFEVIHPDVYPTCIGISLQKWRGKAERGVWVEVGTLKMPRKCQENNEIESKK